MDIKKIVDANPTKELFIYMLTRDISLSQSILDLIDNSIDGAIRSAPSPKKLSRFNIFINFDEERFVIEDNCGGIDLDIARHYAFRFGKPNELSSDIIRKESIGRFGVGMKRTLFKLGDVFVVTSKTTNNSFNLDVDLTKWVKNEKWEFILDKYKEDEKRSKDKTGTRVEVSGLHGGIADTFSLKNFENRLIEDIKDAHSQHFSSGINIFVNNTKVIGESGTLLVSKDLVPAKRHLTFKYPDGDVVVDIVSGVGSSDPSTAGWSVYCNGRCIVNSDKTELTGWGESSEKAVPRFHNQYARFRGYVFMHSLNLDKLPWNTTKTGLDQDSNIFKKTRQDMVVAMRPVITFLNELDKEKDLPSSRLEELVDKSKETPVADVKAAEVFTYKKSKEAKTSQTKTATVTYGVDKDLLDIVRKKIKAKTNKDVGIKTFNYYYEMECE